MLPCTPRAPSEQPLLSLQTNIEISGEMDFSRLLQLEEEHVKKICSDIIALKPDLVFTEKGVSGENELC